jgi:hypothetical protein
MRNDLQQLRLDVITTAPWKFREMITWWMDLEPDFNLYSWQQELIAKVLEHTVVTTLAINFYFKDRALCPLCGDSPDSEPDGFAVPTGLERHLEGYGNQRQCRVVMAARDYIRVRHTRTTNTWTKWRGPRGRPIANDRLRSFKYDSTAAYIGV